MVHPQNLEGKLTQQYPRYRQVRPLRCRFCAASRIVRKPFSQRHYLCMSPLSPDERLTSASQFRWLPEARWHGALNQRSRRQLSPSRQLLSVSRHAQTRRNQEDDGSALPAAGSAAPGSGGCARFRRSAHHHPRQLTPPGGRLDPSGTDRAAAQRRSIAPTGLPSLSAADPAHQPAQTVRPRRGPRPRRGLQVLRAATGDDDCQWSQRQRYPGHGRPASAGRKPSMKPPKQRSRFTRSAAAACRSRQSSGFRPMAFAADGNAARSGRRAHRAEHDFAALLIAGQKLPASALSARLCGREGLVRSLVIASTARLPTGSQPSVA